MTDKPPSRCRFSTHLKALILLIAGSVSASAQANSTYQELMLGTWQCLSEFETLYGVANVISRLDIESTEALLGEGQLWLQPVNVNQSVPLSFEGRSQWQLEETRLRISDIRGQIFSSNPLLNNFATLLQAQIEPLDTLTMEGQLTQLTTNTMRFVTADDVDIRCAREGAVR